jgi:hypothetical protein
MKRIEQRRRHEEEVELLRRIKIEEWLKRADKGVLNI